MKLTRKYEDVYLVICFVFKLNKNIIIIIYNNNKFYNNCVSCLLFEINLAITLVVHANNNKKQVCLSFSNSNNNNNYIDEYNY